jgi:hypothetical protein
MFRLSAATLALVLAFSQPAAADEVTDTLQSAIEAYNNGDIQYALEEIDYAKSLIGAMKTSAFTAFLPEAPEGWTREIDTGMNRGLAMLGGGVGAEAEYSDGKTTFTIKMMADSPMIAGFVGMLANASMMGIKVERVGREKYMNQNGELSAVVGNRILIQAKGAPVDVMLPLLEEIDYEGLANFGR